MADYAARIEELERLVTDLEARAGEAERSGGRAASPRSYARLREEIADYARFRDAVFADGLGLLDAGSDATAQRMGAQWADHFIRAATDAFRSFKNITLEDVPSQIVAESIASQESVAWAEISTWRLARVQGVLSERVRTLDTESAGLESKWSETIGQDERQDGQVAGLRVQVLQMLEDCIKDIRGWGPRLEETVHTIVTGWEASERPSPDPSFAEPGKAFVEILATLSRTLEDSVRAAQLMYATELTLHEVFGAHRAAVAEMLEAAEPDLVAKDLADAVSAAESGAGRMFYDGQRTDLKKYVEKVTSLVAPKVDAYGSAFEQFVKRFEGRYTGKVSEETVKLLAEAEFFDQFWREIEDLHLPAEIHETQEGIARLKSVDLSRVTDELREELRAILAKQLEEIGQSIRNLDLSILERFRVQFIATPREAIVDKLRRLAGYDA